MFNNFLFLFCCIVKNAPSINLAKSDSQNICGFSVLVITYNEKNKDKKNEKNILSSVD